MIKISPINETKVKIHTDAGTLQEIADAFKFRVDGFQHMPSFKMGYFDGWIRLVDLRTGNIPKGLIPDLLRWCNERDYEIVVDESIVKPFKEKIDFQWEDLNIGFDPRDYQEEAVKRCLAKKRQILLASTGAGKSLMIYATIRGLQNSTNKKILLVVPSIGLVEQMYSDFANYSKNDEIWEAEDNCHKIYGGESKRTQKQVVISTWQSLQNLEEDYFDQFGAVLFDEVHTCVGKTVASIMDRCTKAFFRFGFTGTLQDSKTNEMQLKALFGPIHRVTNTKDLMEKGVLADLKIKVIILKHNQYLCDLANAKGFSYKQEMDLICMQDTRNNFITKLVNTRKGNSLVLFQYVEKHGKVLYEKIKKKCGEGWNVQFIYGGTDVEQRENARKIMERSNPGTVLNFGKFCLKIPFGIDVELEGGETVKSEEITNESDISERWIEINKGLYKY
jgi:superfamily II DNA or RNA helicase